MNAKEKADLRKFLEGVVCAGLKVPLVNTHRNWFDCHLSVKVDDTPFWSYAQLENLVKTVEAVGFPLDGGKVLVESDMSIFVVFGDIYGQLEKQSLNPTNQPNHET